ncbi:hypothetical protein LJC34_01705 [Oscillospiraceae bacterium OttesenSCG-928-G22]|nr:hypothetical protein [Oscillospiraceae bacterium OttesenSCG-928-G22]
MSSNESNNTGIFFSGTLSDGKLLFRDIEYRLGEEMFQGPFYHDDSTVIYMTNDSDKNMTSTRESYYAMNLSDMSSEQIVQIPALTVDSGSSVTIQNNYYTCPARENENGELVNYLTEIQFDKHQANVLLEMKLQIPFVYFSKLNDEEFIMLTHKQYNGTGLYSEVQRFNVVSNEFMPLISCILDVEPSNDGEMIEQICARDGHIVVVRNKQHNGKIMRYIQVYTREGILESEISSNELDRYLYDTRTLRVIANGNYFYMINWRMETKLFKSVEGNLIETDLGVQKSYPLSYYENATYSEKLDRVYFISHEERENGGTPTFLYALDTTNGVVIKWGIDFGDGCTRLSGGMVDLYGNLVLMVHTSDDINYENPKYFYVDATSLLLNP